MTSVPDSGALFRPLLLGIVTGLRSQLGVAVLAWSEPASAGDTRGAYDVLAAEPRLDATAVQTVGLKGYDGFAIAVVSNE